MNTRTLTPHRLCRRAAFAFLLFAALCALAGRAGAQLYVAQNYGNNVGEYDAASGAAINASLISTGLNFPFALALSGNNLFVANGQAGTVGEYNATTGAAINTSFISVSSPSGLAVAGGNLFVVSPGRVGEYDATSGAAINANFINGLNTTFGIAISGNNLYVVTSGLNGTIGKYNATTGAAINTSFVNTGLSIPTVLLATGNSLFAGLGLSVGQYDATTGATINSINGIGYAEGLAVLGSDLYVADNADGTVREYDVATGSPINANLITINDPTGLAVVQPAPEPSQLMLIGLGLPALIGMRWRRRDL